MIKSLFVAYLRRRLNSPVAWMIAFGGICLVYAAIEGFKQEGWEGAVGGAFVGGSVAGAAGLLIGVFVWIAHGLWAEPAGFAPGLVGLPADLPELCVAYISGRPVAASELPVATGQMSSVRRSIASG